MHFTIGLHFSVRSFELAFCIKGHGNILQTNKLMLFVLLGHLWCFGFFQ